MTDKKSVNQNIVDMQVVVATGNKGLTIESDTDGFAGKFAQIDILCQIAAAGKRGQADVVK